MGNIFRRPASLAVYKCFETKDPVIFAVTQVMCKLKSSLVQNFCLDYAQNCLKKIEKTRLMLEWLTSGFYDDEEKNLHKPIAEFMITDFSDVVEIQKTVRDGSLYVKYFTGDFQTRTGVCVEFDHRDITIMIGCMDKDFDLFGFGERFCEWHEGDDFIQSQLSYEKG